MIELNIIDIYTMQISLFKLETEKKHVPIRVHIIGVGIIVISD